MPEKRGFLKFYLLLAILIGIFGIVDNSLIFLKLASETYITMVSLLLFFYFFFNILAILVFYHQKQEPINYVLPLYHMITAIIFSIVGIYFSAPTFFILVSLLVIGYLTSLFEIGFGACLVKKFGLIPTKQK